ncbi:MAG TPA: hypothetical protein P5054_10905 [Desulfomonilia bacterium]|nr:hypothetical protein [Desulfomonilia bacterium]
MKGRLMSVTGLLGVVAGVLLPIGSCDIDDYDPHAVATEADFVESLGFELDIPMRALRLAFDRAVEGEGGNLTVSGGDDGGITGLLFPDDSRIRIDAGSRIDVDASGFWTPESREFSITVEEHIIIEKSLPAFGESFPSEGGFVVADGENVIAVDFLPVAGVSGVSLSLNGSAPVFHTMDAFEAFAGSSFPIWKTEASLSFLVLDHLAEQIFFIADTVDIIESHSGGLAGGGGIVFLCDSLLSDTEQDPLDPESARELSWTDTDGSGLIDTGDRFQWTFVQCWEEDPGDLVSDLVDGIVMLSGYVIEREQEDSRRVITGFGFVAGPEESAGVLYDDFTWMKAERVSSGSFAFDTDRSFTISGGFDLTFSLSDIQE